jgi:DNA-binding NarL/FixJ family response regulator
MRKTNSPILQRPFLSIPVQQAPLAPRELTKRERDILQLVWSGMKSREIAARLKLSVLAVEAQRATMMRRLGVGNTAGLLKAAIQYGLIEIT